MRIIPKLRISKGMCSSLMNAAVVAAFVGLINLPAFTAANEMGDMESFIEEQLVPAPEELENLGAFIENLPEDSQPVIVVPIPEKPMKEPLSDGKFETLSTKWKRGVMQVVADKRCDKHAKAFQVSAKIDPILQEAHAIVESNCDAAVVGKAGEIGIFQVMPKTCKEIGVVGDYRNPLVNATCTEKYRLTLCATSKQKCTAKLMFLAHNRGISGALRTADAATTQYVRKVDCAARALRGHRCA